MKREAFPGIQAGCRRGARNGIKPGGCAPEHPRSGEGARPGAAEGRACGAGVRALPPRGRLNARGWGDLGVIKPQTSPERAARGSGQSGLGWLPAAPRRAPSPGAAGGKPPDFEGKRDIFRCVEVTTSYIPPSRASEAVRILPHPRNWRGCRQEGAIKPLPWVFFPLGAGTERPGKAAPAGEAGLKAAPPALQGRWPRPGGSE